MLKQISGPAAVLILAGMLVACDVTPKLETPNPVMTNQGTPIGSPSAVLPTISAGESPESTIISAVPFPNTPLFNGYLFASPNDSQCQLPCWHGLIVGVSDRDDVQTTFRLITGLGNSYDFFEEFQIADPIEIGVIDDIPEDSIAGYDWSNGVEYAVRLIAVMDPDSNTLAGINLELGANTFTPQFTLQKLGAPTSMLVWTVQTLYGADINSTYLYGDKGMAISFSLFSDLPIEEANNRQYVTYCLDAPHGFSESVIVEPFTDLGADNLSLLQRNWISYTIPSDANKIEDVSDMTPRMLAERTLSEENVCLQIDYLR